MTAELYKTTLYSANLSKVDLREAIVQIQNRILESKEYDGIKQQAIVKKINKRKKQDEKFPSSNTYLAIVSNSRTDNKTSSIPYYEATKESNLIEFLVFFFQEYAYWYNCNKKIIVYGKSKTYNGFYYRTNAKCTGVLKLEIKNWNTGKLRFHYKKREYPFREFDLTFETENKFKDFVRASFGDKSGISGTIVLALQEDEDKRKIIQGLITYFNNDYKKINSTHLILEEENEILSIAETQYLVKDYDSNGERSYINIPNEYDYYLNSRNLILDSNIAYQRNEFMGSFDANEISKIANNYQSIHLTTHKINNSPILKFYKLVITKDGLVVHEKTDGRKDIGIAKLVNHKLYIHLIKSDSGSFESNRNGGEQIFFDKITYTLILQKNDSDLFFGKYVGVVNEEISSGSIVLESSEHTKVQKFENLDRDELFKAIKANTKNNIKIADYLELPFNSIHTNDGHPKGGNNFVTIPDNLRGEYSCYFAQRRGKNKDPDVSRFGQTLEKMPIFIDNDFVVKFGQLKNEYQGDIFLGSNSKDVQIQVSFKYSDFNSTLLFILNDIKDISRIYGIITIVHDKVVESSNFVMINNKILNTSYANENYKSFSTMSEIQLQDEITSGGVTKIIGFWNRGIYINEPNDFPFTIRMKSYRRVYWNSACYNFQKACEEENFLIKKELLNEVRYDFKRAYLHGFGMQSFGQSYLNTPDFPEELIEENTMIESFDSLIKNYLKSIEVDEINTKLYNKVYESFKGKWRA